MAGAAIFILIIWIAYAVLWLLNLGWLANHIIEFADGDHSFTTVFWGIVNVAIFLGALRLNSSNKD